MIIFARMIEIEAIRYPLPPGWILAAFVFFGGAISTSVWPKRIQSRTGRACKSADPADLNSVIAQCGNRGHNRSPVCSGDLSTGDYSFFNLQWFTVATGNPHVPGLSATLSFQINVIPQVQRLISQTSRRAFEFRINGDLGRIMILKL